MQTETDYSDPTLHFIRYYHSATLEAFHGIGIGWTHNYATQLILSNGIPTGLLRPDGHQEQLAIEFGTTYLSLSGSGLHVAATSPNWTVYLADGSTEIYGPAGTLIQLVSPGGAVTTLNYTNGVLSSVVGPYGHTLQFAYNPAGQISTITDPANNVITYTYDGNGNPANVLFPDGATRYYQFSNSAFPNHLMGIRDEIGNQFLTVTYDSNGRATSSQNAGGANAVSLVYDSTAATVADGIGGTTVYGFTAPANYTPRVTSIVRNGLTTTYAVPSPSVDPQQRATQRTDANGNVTQYAYDSDHLTSTTQAFGTTVARTTTYQYLSTLSALPTLIAEPLRQTSMSYYSGTNNIHTKTIIDTSVSPAVSRTWTYTYNNYGQVLTVDGPRADVSDVTTYTYYTCTTGAQCGQINTVTNALGQVTTFNVYNTYGQPLTITDPNGVVTTLTYDVRQRVTSRQVGTETTSYSYYLTGLLNTVTLPDASTLTMTYDGAHRLTKIVDGAGNSVSYSLDAMGNRTAESANDPNNVLSRTHSRVFNALNELYQDIGANSASTTSLGYDANGNLTSSAAPLSRNSASQYDALNRLTQSSDPANGITQIGYDANDNVASVTDPIALATTYTHNGFNELSQQVSHATGITTSTYDSGGNLATRTDARGAVATSSYDALNRVTSTAYKIGGITDQTLSYTYDTGTNGQGHLTAARDANHAMAWSYDALGRVTGMGQTVGGVTRSIGYGYTNGDVTTLTTPSGQTISYTYANHQITGITVNSTTLLATAAYEPFGPVRGWTWGNGTTEVRLHDTDGNPSQLSSIEASTVSYDAGYRITGIANSTNSALSWTYGYDSLDRTTSASQMGTTLGYAYNADGDRLSQTGASTPSPLWTSAASFTYNARGRMSSATVSATTTYLYNALGQMIQKSNSTTTLLLYDTGGHLVGEYTGGGALIQETVWLNDLPVATLRPNGTGISIYYVHADQLGSPKLVTRPADNVILWRWDTDPFGTASPNPNPQPQGTFIYNLRFPGQYYQAETGLMYSYARDYDPATGRFLESDPIGLGGGINTYAYASDNPVMRDDPSGLFSLTVGTQVSVGDYIANNTVLGWTPYIGGNHIGYTQGIVSPPHCQCKGCGSSWKLGQCSAFLDINVQIESGLNSIADGFSRRAEYEHVGDLSAGLASIQQAGATAERSQQQLTFSTKSDCELRSSNAVQAALQHQVNVVSRQSWATHDNTGDHNYPGLWPF